MNQIIEMAATEMTAAMQTGSLSVQEVLQAHIDRIEAVNPEVNAVVALDLEAATDQAREMDRTFRSDGVKGALYGLPTAHKDLLPTRGIRTTRGSRVYQDWMPETDHLVVERMKSADAITLGKTNVPEFGLGSHTFNDVYGMTRNPYDLTKSAGGSSGGAAAALAARMLPIADGSDVGGSLRNPTSFCNVVGLRPTPGRVASWPDAAAWGRLSVNGPMARNVEDAALLLSVLAGPDPRSPMSLETPGEVFRGDYDTAVSSRRVAFSADLNGLVPVEQPVREVLQSAVEVIEELGHRTQPAAPDLSAADHVFSVLRAWQLDYTLREVLDDHREELKDDAVWNIEIGAQLTGRDIGLAEVEQTRIHHLMREFFQHYDFLVTPVSQAAPFDIDLTYPTEVAGVPMDNYLEWMRLPSLISVTGCPAISVPVGFTPEGLPVGIQIIAPPRAERELLEFAHTVEQAGGTYRARPETL